MSNHGILKTCNGIFLEAILEITDTNRGKNTVETPRIHGNFEILLKAATVFFSDASVLIFPKVFQHFSQKIL